MLQFLPLLIESRTRDEIRVISDCCDPEKRFKSDKPFPKQHDVDILEKDLAQVLMFDSNTTVSLSLDISLTHDQILSALPSFYRVCFLCSLRGLPAGLYATYSLLSGLNLNYVPTICSSIGVYRFKGSCYYSMGIKSVSSLDRSRSSTSIGGPLRQYLYIALCL
ncbi:hypothetical protein Tco_0417523 [Tanacetum coccineum]